MELKTKSGCIMKATLFFLPKWKTYIEKSIEGGSLK
jgi:hypothetical protein